MLDDPDFYALEAEHVRPLVLIWLLASESKTGDGELPSLDKIAFRLRMSENETERHLNALHQWVTTDDINMISKRYQNDTPETETEGETETETETDIRVREESKKEDKKPYGEFRKVTLTDDEFSKLQKSYGQLLNQAIETLDAYMASKGKKYESCYAIMKRDGWVWEKVHMAAKPKDSFGRPADSTSFAPDLGREERERIEYQRRLAKTMNDVRPGSAVIPC